MSELLDDPVRQVLCAVGLGVDVRVDDVAPPASALDEIIDAVPGARDASVDEGKWRDDTRLEGRAARTAEWASEVERREAEERVSYLDAEAAARLIENDFIRSHVVDELSLGKLRGRSTAEVLQSVQRRLHLAVGFEVTDGGIKYLGDTKEDQA